MVRIKKNVVNLLKGQTISKANYSKEDAKDGEFWFFLRPYIGFNTSHLTDSYIIFTLKMESVPKNDSKKWSRKKSF